MSRVLRGNLPVEVTDFVGRRRELSKARCLLESTRLLTFVGVAGVGKTRLAERLASKARRAFEDGVWLVDLATLQDGELLAQKVAATLGLADRSPRSPLDSLLDFVADKRMLIVLDNCEHLLDACATLAVGLLEGAAGVQILATSREALGIVGETIFDVSPLSLTPDEAIPGAGGAECDAVRLFVSRAVAAAPEFSLTAENRQDVFRLCQRLDGIPLAIELAAVLLRSLSVKQVLERLDNVYQLLTGGSRVAPKRQQTLAAAIDWTRDLCAPRERILWRRLSVFSGGFDLRAAEDVCSGGDIAPEDILNLICGLINKSVVVTESCGDEMRYRLLETIRQYGRMLLAESGEEKSVTSRHRNYVLSITKRAEQAWFSPDQMQWNARLRLERANIRAALDSSLNEPGEEQAALEIAAADYPYRIFFGMLGEGRYWLKRALRSDQTQTAARAKALWVAGRLALLQGDIVGGEPLLQACAELAERVGDASAEAHSVDSLGLAALLQGNNDRAISLLEKALKRYRAIGESAGYQAIALYRLAMAAAAAGNAERTFAYGEESLALCEANGAESYRPLALWIVAIERFRRGDVREATTMLAECLRIQRSVKDLWNTAHSIEGMAWLTAANGQHGQSARLLGAAHTIWRSLGSKTPQTQPYMDFHDHCRSRVHASLGEEGFAVAFQQGEGFTVDQAIDYALHGQAAPSGRSPKTTRAPSILTRREWEVAELVAKGLTNKDIAAALVISQRTAEGHIEHIMKKLGFTARAQIASWTTQRSESERRT